MGLRGGHKPGSFERRYQRVTPEQRRTYYAFQRHLGIPPAEVDRLPMLVKRMFIEELNAEFSKDPSADPEEETPVIGKVTDDLGMFGLVAHEI